jgi:hypothetical protein
LNRAWCAPIALGARSAFAHLAPLNRVPNFSVTSFVSSVQLGKRLTHKPPELQARLAVREKRNFTRPLGSAPAELRGIVGGAATADAPLT